MIRLSFIIIANWRVTVASLSSVITTSPRLRRGQRCHAGWLRRWKTVDGVASKVMVMVAVLPEEEHRCDSGSVVARLVEVEVEVVVVVAWSVEVALSTVQEFVCTVLPPSAPEAAVKRRLVVVMVMPVEEVDDTR